MRIWEHPSADVSALAMLRAAAGSGAECFTREDGRCSLVLCESGSVPPDTVEKRVSVLFSGGRSGADAGPWVFCVGLWMPADWAVEFCAWYRHEHAPILLECPVWSGFRFVEQPVAEGRQFYALHWLADRAALDSEFRKRSRSTPWFLRLAQNDWFDGAFVRVLAKRTGS